MSSKNNASMVELYGPGPGVAGQTKGDDLMPELTRKRARQYTRRRLETIKTSLEICAYYWEDLDQMVKDEIESVRGEVEDLHDMMNDSCNEEDGLI